MSTLIRIEEILNRIVMAPSGISMRHDWQICLLPKGDVKIRCGFWRIDTDTGTLGKGYGRWWLIDAGSTEKAILMTAWLALQQVVAHELLESFSYRYNDGEAPVRVFDPHKSLENLLWGGRPVSNETRS